MKASDISTYIALEATSEEIEAFITAIKFRRESLSRANKFAFKVGQKVSFNNRRAGKTETGSIVKIAIKKAQVKVGNTTWTVPFNMLQAA